MGNVLREQVSGPLACFFFPAPPFHREAGPAGRRVKPKQKPFKPIYGMKGCTRFT
jgi:hypothetical protein